MFIADTRKHGRSKPQSRRTESNIRSRPTHIFCQACHVLQPAANLLTVKINGSSPDANEIQV
jgi:hypothetical protein